MKQYKAGSKAQPFPRLRPPVIINPSRAKPFSVDCKECWRLMVTPVVGQSSMAATFRANSRQPEKWELWSVDRRRGERAAGIHWITGVEIMCDRWEAESGWQLNCPYRSYLALTSTHVQWLAELTPSFPIRG